jgi:hypothetical protein
MRVKNSFMAFAILISLYLVSVAVLKNRNDFVFLLVFAIICILYVISISNLNKMFDRVFSVLLPISFGITKVAWIAHPLNDANSVLSSSAGLYINLTDVVLIYLLFRTSTFKGVRSKTKTIIFIYLASVLLSCFTANVLEFSLAGCFLYAKCFIVYSWFANNPYYEKYRKYFVEGVKISVIFQGGIAIAQKVINGPVGLTFLGESDEALRYRIVGDVIERGSSGTFPHSGALAIFVLFALLVLWLNEKQKFKAFFVVWCLGIMYLASSRTAFLVLIIALMYNMWKHRSKLIRKKIAIFLPIGYVAMIFGVVIATKKGMFDFIMNSDIIYQIGDRLSQWELAFTFISRRWWIFGYGVNNYTSVTSQIDSSLFIYVNPVHNNYILNWFEVGILGLISFVCIYLSFLAKANRYNSYSTLAKSSLLFLICTAIYNFTGWSFATVPCIYLFWVALGILEKENQRRLINYYDKRKKTY